MTLFGEPARNHTFKSPMVFELTVRDYAPYVPSKIKKAMPCKSRSRPIVDAGICAEASSSSESRPSTPSSTTTPLALPAEVAKGSDDAGGMMMGVGEKKEKPAGRLSRPAPLTGRSSRQRMVLTLVMMPWTIRYQDPWWQNADGGKPC